MKIGKVLNKRVHGVPAGAKYIGRGSPHGNKFVIGQHGDRDAVCEQHDLDLARDRAKLKKLDELAGCDVVCFCAPARCHGDTLVSLAAMPFEQRLVWALRTIAAAEAAPKPDQPAFGGIARGVRRQLR
ncbi:DUF4326 domain-containing protein [Sphingomonas sp. 3-13AW]|uniref:DUF4326 domain-containing protein n=1 Tax=Sphingomonas sp. 3-13AW TaxID=3050450 RepID=UPI003BB56C94